MKLQFEFGPHADHEHEGHAERIWVEVLDVGHGRLRNRPARLDKAILEEDREPDLVVRAPGPYVADQDEWWMLCRDGAGGPTVGSVNDLTDRFPELVGPLRAGSGVWERSDDGYSLVPAAELETGKWPALLRWLEQTAARMRQSATS